jgi:hypothetical protein
MFEMLFVIILAYAAGVLVTVFVAAGIGKRAGNIFMIVTGIMAAVWAVSIWHVGPDPQINMDIWHYIKLCYPLAILLGYVIAFFSLRSDATRREDAITVLRRRLTSNETAGADTFVVARDLQDIGRLQLRSRHYEEACASFERAHTLLATRAAYTDPVMRELCGEYILALRAANRRQEADRLAGLINQR